MKVEVIRIGSLSELFEALDKALSDNSKKDKARGLEKAEARYDKFIDNVFDLVDIVVECGAIKRDCALYRKDMHDSPFEVKRAFYKNFAPMFGEVVDDIVKLSVEYAYIMSGSKKTTSDDKSKDKKVEDTQPKKEKQKH